jgi:hypothetical protein
MTGVQRCQPTTDITAQLVDCHESLLGQAYGTSIFLAAADEIAALKARITELEEALRSIMEAAVEGRVCSDVAWFDNITTLHDFCDLALSHAGPDARDGEQK